jgi:hypothetical protein
MGVHHVAVTRNQTSGPLRIFVDGVLDAEGSGPTGDVSYRDGRSTSNPKDRIIAIGAEKHDISTSQYPSYSGWVDELRISNTIRYTSNFTPPTSPFNSDANTAGLYISTKVRSEHARGRLLIVRGHPASQLGNVPAGGSPAVRYTG